MPYATGVIDNWLKYYVQPNGGPTYRAEETAVQSRMLTLFALYVSYADGPEERRRADAFLLGHFGKVWLLRHRRSPHTPSPDSPQCRRSRGAQAAILRGQAVQSHLPPDAFRVMWALPEAGLHAWGRRLGRLPDVSLTPAYAGQGVGGLAAAPVQQVGCGLPTRRPVARYSEWRRRGRHLHR